MDTTESSPKPPKHRSPSYPAYDLQTALVRAKQLHDIAGVHRANISTVVAKWGYTIKSSKGPLTLATLKKFGLAEDMGKADARGVQLTTLGRELVYFDPDRTSSQWRERAQAAAMQPAIHSELWTRYDGHLPTNTVMQDYLVLERGFSKAAAADVISEFRRTLEFAGVGTPGAPDIVLDDGPEDAEERHEEMPVSELPSPTLPTERHSGPIKRVAVPTAPLPVNVNLATGNHATLEVTARLTQDEWDELMAVLNAMKGGLTVRAGT